MSKPVKSRPFISRPRCIYTGNDLDASDGLWRPSHEHIIPLSLGGSDDFVTDDVALTSNSRAGNEIDDEVASSFPFLCLRHRYGLQGNRRVIPNIKISGEFLDLQARAKAEISASGEIVFSFIDETQVDGQIMTIASTEERVRFLLKGRLASANKRQMKLATPYGFIEDEEDIEIALLLADRNEGRQFKGRVTIDTKQFHFAFARLVTKVAIGLGHRVLGPEWTFGAGGHRLRQALFASTEDKTTPLLRGTLHADVPPHIKEIVGIVDDHHVMSVLPIGKTTVATIALFGGDCGVAVIDLGYDSRRHFMPAILLKEDIDCAFAIPISSERSKRGLISRSLKDLTQAGVSQGLLPKNKVAAKLQHERYRADRKKTL
jgi:hypothetical protein